MGAINRNIAEPPAHLECCHYAAKVCPFLAVPEMRRQEHNLPTNTWVSGEMIKRNPGAICLWTVEKYRTWRPAPGELLFDIGEPHSVEWWSQGEPRPVPKWTLQSKVACRYWKISIVNNRALSPSAFAVLNPGYQPEERRHEHSHGARLSADPDRSCDWSAIDGDTADGALDTHPPCPAGWGATEAEAIADLLEQI